MRISGEKKTLLKHCFWGKRIQNTISAQGKMAGLAHLRLFSPKYLIPPAKYGNGKVMFSDCFAAANSFQIKIIKITMNSLLYQRLLKENMITSVRKLKLMLNMKNDNGNMRDKIMLIYWHILRKQRSI